jgi:hypothetical protein
MSILIDKNTKIVVQGLTGEAGSIHGNGMLEYGSAVVAGVTPGKGGTSWESKRGVKIPVFNTVEHAVKATGANASCIFVPGAAAADGASRAGNSARGPRDPSTKLSVDLNQSKVEESESAPAAGVEDRRSAGEWGWGPASLG